jgi:hypothetical protein
MAVHDHSADDDEKPLSPEQQRIVAKARWLMLLSGLATVLGIAVVLGVVGFRMYRAGTAAVPAADVIAALPKDAKITGITVSEGRIAVTLNRDGALEVRVFDLETLRPAGRLRFATEP